MPRKTSQDNIGVSSAEFGPAVRLIDEKGDSLVDEPQDAIKVTQKIPGGDDLSDIRGVMDEQLGELRRIRRIGEIAIDEEVEPIEE